MEQSLREALAAYGMETAETTFLRHNENATYHVFHLDREYVLRVHASRPGFSLGVLGVDRHNRGKLEGELAMLCALAEGGFPVQRPVENRAGDGVTTLASGDCATMLTWLDGDVIGEVTDEIARDAARLAGRMHLDLASRGNLIGIDRYRYDEALIETLRAPRGGRGSGRRVWRWHVRYLSGARRHRSAYGLLAQARRHFWPHSRRFCKGESDPNQGRYRTD